MINEAVKAEVQMQISANAGSIWNSIQSQVKRAAIAQVMHECCNNQSAAAKALGINRISLRSWIKQVFSESEMKEMGIES
jgi:DNA-binding protein Fis